MPVFYPKRAGRQTQFIRSMQALILVILLSLLAACASISGSRGRPFAPLAVPAPTSGSVPNTGPGHTYQVRIRDFDFQPVELTIPVGATVVWTEVGQNPHTVTADDQSFKSESLKNGATFQYTFTRAGTYRYYCEFHGYKGGAGMSGVVKVVAPGSSSTVPETGAIK